MIGAGRTDTGVHATGQVASVDMPGSWTPSALKRSLNALLSDAIWIAGLETAPVGFHPRFDATARTYRYYVGTEPAAASPFRRRWCWPVGQPLDFAAAQEAASELTCQRNFRAFTKSGQPGRGFECHVHYACWDIWKHLGAVFEIRANRFLHRMVRYLVGTMVDVGKGRREAADLGRMLRGDESLTTSPPAPPGGLFLARVDYDEQKKRIEPTVSAGYRETPGRQGVLKGEWQRHPSEKQRPANRAGLSVSPTECSRGFCNRLLNQRWPRSPLVAACGVAGLLAIGCAPEAESARVGDEDVATATVASSARAAAAPGASLPAPEEPPRAGDAAAGQESGALSRDRSTAIVRAARQVAPAVVTISVLRTQRQRGRNIFFDDYFLPFRQTQGLGSGFIVDPRGTVLTNHHVVENAEEILVTLPDGRDFEARLVGSDPATDVAVLSVSGADDLPVAPLGSASGLLIGEWTLAIGNPFGRLISNPEPSVTAGVVSAIGRHIVPGQNDNGFYLGMIQTDAAINPGNSGGPLVNAVGEVIGINTSILSRSGGSEGLGFAIPINRALRVARDLVDYGEVRRAWLGLEVDEVEADRFARSRGVRVARVTPGSPAAEAGIRPGARLLTAGDSRMATPLDYAAVKLDLRAGDRISLTVEDRGEVVLEAVRLPSFTASRVELLRDLQVVTVTPAIRAERGFASSEGALVVEISEEVARQAGLAPGDVLLAVNNQRVTSAEGAAEELRRTQQSGRAFVLVFERNGRVVRSGLLQWR